MWSLGPPKLRISSFFFFLRISFVFRNEFDMVSLIEFWAGLIWGRGSDILCNESDTLLSLRTSETFLQYNDY